MFLILSGLTFLKKFANDSLDFLSRILLRKQLTIPEAFHAAKLAKFRKTSKDFMIYFFLAKKSHSLVLAQKLSSG